VNECGIKNVHFDGSKLGADGEQRQGGVVGDRRRFARKPMLDGLKMGKNEKKAPDVNSIP
jgi:hypothetical protein